MSFSKAFYFFLLSFDNIYIKYITNNKIIIIQKPNIIILKDIFLFFLLVCFVYQRSFLNYKLLTFNFIFIDNILLLNTFYKIWKTKMLFEIKNKEEFFLSYLFNNKFIFLIFPKLTINLYLGE